jgi:Asp-tRNA(Asn)/Glu-tRNA(Gln) amidotransferase A subunit family amidase
MSYDLQTIKAPRLAGKLLRMAASLAENGATQSFLVPQLLKSAGVDRFRQASFAESPSVAPDLPHPGTPVGERPVIDLEALTASAPEGTGFRFETVSDFARAYREGRATPESVARRYLAAVKQSDEATPKLRAITATLEEEVLKQARASTERFQRKAPLGPFDGVPVAVKEELDVVPYPTTVGTRFLKNVATVDATVVARLRAAGAIIVGKANMHEIGIDTSGYNAHHGTARNPYDPNHYTGGSSSGSGSVVAAGLVPVAIGADGGGSIRIPSALCGIAGLKATWGRVSEAGAAPLCWSVAHVGPMASSVRDVALTYALIAGSDPRDPNSQKQPPPSLDGLGDTNVRGLRIGIFRPWFEHASAEVVERCRGALKVLEERGATLVDVEIPDLEWGRIAHAVTIISEMATGVDPYDREHRTEYAPAVRLTLALARVLNNRDYIRAQQVRTRLSNHFRRAFEQVDVIATPTTATTAPAIRPDALAFGESDLDMTSALMRYVFPTNLTGHPALSVNAGYDAKGLPVGLQLMGRPWEEHLLLRVGEVVEQSVERRAPKVHFRLLEG